MLAELLAEQSGHVVELKSSVRSDRAQFLQMAERNARASLTARLASRQTLGTRFDDLQKVLELDFSPRRIECFDISHTMGEATVASCVVFGPEGAGEIALPPLQYRGHHAGRRLRCHASGADPAVPQSGRRRGREARRAADRWR
jgi:hypothetical protein